MPTYQITINGHAYKVDVPNPNERPIRAIIDGETIEVYIENDTPSDLSSGETTSQASATMTPRTLSPEHVTSNNVPPTASPTGVVKSPLPGTIVRISVKEGDRVEAGQELCVLEAMKMNNPIRSTINGEVTEIQVSIGQQVQHGAPLMIIEE
jgi:biotin carboxyl carrier protein